MKAPACCLSPLLRHSKWLGQQQEPWAVWGGETGGLGRGHLCALHGCSLLFTAGATPRSSRSSRSSWEFRSQA